MSAPLVDGLTVGVLGGTGPQGRSLALRWARAGLPVRIGSRDAARASAAAEEIRAAAGVDDVSGTDNAGCAAASDVVLVAVPWEAHEPTLAALTDELAGRLVIDCVNPLGFDARGPHALAVADGSAAEQAARLLPRSRVTAAFHHVSAVLLADLAIESIDTDVLVLGEDRADTDIVQALAETIPGFRGVYGGRLRNAHQVEAMTANLIAINRRYKTHSGIRITGLAEH
jgi:NADPH-dependent F420 reductase